MEQYIPKSVVLAEIEKLMYAANLEADIASADECFDEKVADAKYQLCKHFLSFLNTLEVKEVDLKKEIDDFMAKEWEGVEEKDEPLYSMIKNDLTDVAKHFFELGMAVSNKEQKGE